MNQHFLHEHTLVGGFNPLKNMKVSWDDSSQYTEKYKMFQTTNQYTIWLYDGNSLHPLTNAANIAVDMDFLEMIVLV